MDWGGCGEGGGGRIYRLRKERDGEYMKLLSLVLTTQDPDFIIAKLWFYTLSGPKLPHLPGGSH